MIVCKSCDGLTLNWLHCDYCRWYVWHDYWLPGRFRSLLIFIFTREDRKRFQFNKRCNLRWFKAVNCRAVDRVWHSRHDRHEKMSETYPHFQPPTENGNNHAIVILVRPIPKKFNLFFSSKNLHFHPKNFEFEIWSHSSFSLGSIKYTSLITVPM